MLDTSGTFCYCAKSNFGRKGFAEEKIVREETAPERKAKASK
jgi:hypothetical protein